MIALKLTVFFCLMIHLMKNQKQCYSLYFCQPSPTKYHWNCYQKIFYLLRFSLLRLNTVKPSFEVAFVVISGSSTSSSLSDVVCCANSGKYWWKSFQHLQSFMFSCLVPIPADLIIMESMRHIMVPFSECHLSYFYSFLYRHTSCFMLIRYFSVYTW